MQINKALIIVAHPDDEVLGCGGLIDKLIKLKKKVKVIFIAEGSSCRYDEISDKKLIERSITKRSNFALNALKVLKVDNFVFYNLKCGSLNQYPLVKINKIIENEISKFKPDTIITHNHDDCNSDHRVVNNSVMIATRPTPKTTIKNVLLFEILSSTEWNFNSNFKPNVYFNIKKNLKNKIKAFKMYYDTEGKKFPFPRSFKGIEILSNYRGMQTGIENAEAYILLRSLKN